VLRPIDYLHEEYNMAGKSRGQSGEDKPLDRTDERILRKIDELHKQGDPMPEDLNERVLRALKED
jgi:hypothetical protein